jgi:PRTRC genetic system protein A
MLRSARRQMPDEVMFQLLWDGTRRNAVTQTWRCVMPGQVKSPTAVRFDDDGQAVIDVHSHNSMSAFFSETDDDDEQGLRFYVVIGKINTARPEICVRVGVYGTHWGVPALTVFDSIEPFVDVRRTYEMEIDVPGNHFGDVRFVR